MSRTGRPGLPEEVRLEFWRRRHEGLSTKESAVAVGVEYPTAKAWVRKAGGMIPQAAKRPADTRSAYLTITDRETIASMWATGSRQWQIAEVIGRSPSTVCKEIKRNSNADGTYRSQPAQARARQSARRPKPCKLEANPTLATVVQEKLDKPNFWSPQQIGAWLCIEYPDDESMRISHEVIYQELYCQTRGALRADLGKCLRTGRAIRRPRTRSQGGKGKITGKIMISERPAEVADRAVPGHIEGDLIIGEGCKSAIGTMVERTSRFTMLLHLPNGHSSESVRDAITETIITLPAALRRSLTWDQGTELARHAEITIATHIPVYFCDPHSPWQRGTNENTNGLLRQYFPKGTDLSVHSRADLDFVADKLNTRPRQTLGWKTPAQRFAELVSESAK